MSNPDALDYSWARPDPHAMAAAGIKLVCRYLTGTGKAVSRAEIDALHAAGIGVLLNYEAGAGAALGGAAVGRSDGQQARAAADALGAPGLPIYYSVDRDIADGQLGTVAEYLRAADDPQHPSRCYGEADVLDAFGRPGWQTIAWSGGHLSGHAVLYQYEINKLFDGSEVDHNRIINAAEIGAWWPNGSPYAQPEALIVNTQDEATVKAIVHAEVKPVLDQMRTKDGYGLETLIDRAVASQITRLLNPTTLATAIAARVPGATTAQVEAAVKAVIDGATLQVP